MTQAVSTSRATVRLRVYACAARDMRARCLEVEGPFDPAEYAASVDDHAQVLRYRAHAKLTRALLEDSLS